jgi:threonine/homoserine/homoserine lactone efflux protein
MDTSALVAFTVVAAAMVVLPGPDWALVLAAGSRPSGAVMVPTIGGLALGYALLTGVVATGLGPLIAAAPVALVVLTVVGAAYLIYLGVRILCGPATGVPEAHAVAPVSRLGSVLRGMGVSALNPKALLFFLAFLPQFARPAAPWPLAGQLFVLGGVWVVLIVAFYTALGHAARTLSGSPGRARAVSWLAGAVMILAGLGLLAEQLAW